jgi:hypothetical protein
LALDSNQCDIWVRKQGAFTTGIADASSPQTNFTPTIDNGMGDIKGGDNKKGLRGLMAIQIHETMGGTIS